MTEQMQILLRRLEYFSRWSKSTLVCHTAVFSVVTQRSCSLGGEALRDDTKKGCLVD